jgi:geranylgeranyl diphosphate synthase, type I
MNLTATAELLEIEIQAALESLSGAAELKHIIIDQLSQDKRGIGSGNNPPLPLVLLPVMVCQSLGGSTKKAIPAAAALQFFMAAGDILDDIEDNDSEDSLCHRYGLPLAVNTATALIFVAEKTLAQTNPGGPPKTLKRVMLLANSGYLTACWGQHLDLETPPGAVLTENKYLTISGLKSASTIGNACAIGALLGGAKTRTVARLARFGYYLGMSAQLHNDISGVISGRDIRARKVTLPFIYTLQQAAAKDRSALREYLQRDILQEPDVQAILRMLSEYGAIPYTLVKAELFKQLAGEILDRLKSSGISTPELEALIK